MSQQPFHAEWGKPGDPSAWEADGVNVIDVPVTDFWFSHSASTADEFPSFRVVDGGYDVVETFISNESFYNKTP